ncbi:siderophore-iron reductase FhuF [Escherichia coli]|uniref:siderophore-iron reductase FhuF n=1 Tax=Escherichia coli TaxID=562 RepID=UPI001C37ED99|nr:siderophore-iron reductase FhuF [Escherichia coli]MBV2260963.1 siderophore-iron reductase FhuF [Escherichia coli]MBV2416685.1 siderophore-iron reductase FhuF [Escherichia coli]
MAYRSAPLYEDIIWRTHLQPQDAGLAQAVRATIAEHREHLLEFIRLDEPAPLRAMTLAQWSSPNTLSSLLAVYSDHIYQNATLHSPQQRMETLISQALVPVVQALEATGEINGKLIWSNTGYLINWYLTEMKQLLGEATVESLRHALFFEKTLTNGEDNPLWRTVVLRDGLLVRRTCCQRYRLPDVQQCGDCTLK